jgi:hypothetical protein
MVHIEVRLSRLEDAVLRSIASQYPDASSAVKAQRSAARVTDRRNTGAGFYTTFEIDPSCPAITAASPMGNVTARVQGLAHGMGFILWLKDGRLNQLEGYSFGEDTSGIDLEVAGFDLGGAGL